MIKLLIVNISEYSAEPFPGYVTCSFQDISGKIWYFREKASVVSAENITEETILPIKGYIAGEIISQKEDQVYFCTKNPWDIESEEGETKFYVYENQLIDTDRKI